MTALLFSYVAQMDQTVPRTKRGGRRAEKKMGEVELSTTYTLTEKPTLSLYTPLGIYLPDRNLDQLTLDQDQSPAFLLQP